MPVPLSARTTRVLRIAMLVMIALVALANAAGLDEADADLWIPFVCIIAVMGVGTRGGPVDSLGFVLIEASVVALLGVATFSGSRDGVWVASVGISVLAIGKIAVVEMHRQDGSSVPPSTLRSGEHAALEKPAAEETSPNDLAAVSSAAVSHAAVSHGSLGAPISETSASAAAPQETGLRAKDAPAIPRTISELPPAPMMNPAPQQNVAPIKAKVIEPPRKKRDRNDPTPRSVPIRRP